MLSLIRPDPEERIDLLMDDDLEHSIDFPDNTYAYSVFKPLVIEYDRPVSFEYFWIRAHKATAAFMKKSKGVRYI